MRVRVREWRMSRSTTCRDRWLGAHARFNPPTEVPMFFCRCNTATDRRGSRAGRPLRRGRRQSARRGDRRALSRRRSQHEPHRARRRGRDRDADRSRARRHRGRRLLQTRTRFRQDRRALCVLGCLAACTAAPPDLAAAPAADPRQQQLELASASAIKIVVRGEGWIRVTQPALVAAGLDAAVDPASLRLYADGVEQADRRTRQWRRDLRGRRGDRVLRRRARHALDRRPHVLAGHGLRGARVSSLRARAGRRRRRRASPTPSACSSGRTTSRRFATATTATSSARRSSAHPGRPDHHRSSPRRDLRRRRPRCA